MIVKFKFSKQEKDVFNQIHLLSGRNYEEVQAVYEGFLYSIILAYIEKEPIHFPLFGEIEIQFLRDTLVKEGKEAELEISFQPSKFLKRVIGQIEDKEESDVEKLLKSRIHSALADILEEGN